MVSDAGQAEGYVSSPHDDADSRTGSDASEGRSQDGSGSGDSKEDLGLPAGADPFGNFSFTNYTTLSQVCQ